MSLIRCYHKVSKCKGVKWKREKKNLFFVHVQVSEKQMTRNLTKEIEDLDRKKYRIHCYANTL
jgi:hypothetical protein